MKCDEIQQLFGPYLDSELDAKTTLDIQRHLATCQGCAREFDKQQKLLASITERLKHGLKTDALWERIERSVVASAPSAVSPRLPAPPIVPVGWRAALSLLVTPLRGSLRPAPAAWAALAAVWVVILALNFTAPESGSRAVAGHKAPSALQVHLALVQKQLLMGEMAASPEITPPAQPKNASPGPRSDRRNRTLYT